VIKARKAVAAFTSAQHLEAGYGVEREMSSSGACTKPRKCGWPYRDDSITPGVDGCVVGHLELLHDYAEHQACKLINQVLAVGGT